MTQMPRPPSTRDGDGQTPPAGYPSKGAKRMRRAGSTWRILVHGMEPGGGSGDSWHVSSDRTFGGGDGQDTSVETDGRTFHARHIELPATEFDELVVGRNGFIHLEQMDTGAWWMNIGGVTVWVKADRDGRPRSVSVFGPGDYAEAVDGCSYSLTWDGDEPKIEEKL